MDKEIIVALIGAAAVIISAAIGIVEKRKKTSGSEAKTTITQKAKGNGSTQIGIQINTKGNDKNDR